MQNRKLKPWVENTLLFIGTLIILYIIMFILVNNYPGYVPSCTKFGC